MAGGSFRAAPTTPEPAGPASSRLGSSDPAERREALAELESDRPDPSRIETVERMLLTDPDPGVRALAVRVLLRAASKLPLSIAERGLQDPDDGVRAAMVHLATERCPTAGPLIVRLAVRRRWPMAQTAALERLPDVLAADPKMTEENVETLLSGVATMEPPPLGSERAPLATVARSLGTERLIVELDRPGPRRLGAVRLLLTEGSRVSLRRVAALADDPVEEVRLSAAAARNILGPEHEGPAGTEAWTGEQEPEESSEQPSSDGIIAAVAAALADPDDEVRVRARGALERVRRSAVQEWVGRTLEGSDDAMAGKAALVAEALHLHAMAPALLRRASAQPPEARGPYLGALDALRVDPADLGGLIKAVDAPYRPEAVRLAWLIAGRYALPLLRSLAEDSAAAVRAAALVVLTEALDPAASALARRALEQDSSARVRATAIRLLAQAGGAHRMDALERALADSDPDVRATALDALPPDLSAVATGILMTALRDQDERVWRAALPHLGRLPRREMAAFWAVFRESPAAKRDEIARSLERANGERLLELARSNASAPDWADRALAVDLAARAGSEQAVQVVVEALEDPDPVVRRAAAGALGSLRPVHAVPALGRSLSDPQADVRVESVRALGLIDDDSVLPLLISALKDPAPRVREMAGDSLSRWRSPGLARRLAEALASPELRRPAGKLLEEMGSTSVEPLVDLVVEAGGEVAAEAGGLLDRIAGPEPFVKQLSSRNPGERIRAVEVLGAIGGPDASDWLLPSLSDPDRTIRARAVSLLGELGDPRSLEPLKQVFLGDPVPQVSTAAEAALRRLGGIPPGSKRGPVDLDENEGLTSPPDA